MVINFYEYAHITGLCAHFFSPKLFPCLGKWAGEETKETHVGKPWHKRNINIIINGKNIHRYFYILVEICNCTCNNVYIFILYMIIKEKESKVFFFIKSQCCNYISIHQTQSSKQIRHELKVTKKNRVCSLLLFCLFHV